MPSLRHCQDDELERYLMGHTQDEAELAQVEEHLIACAKCAARAEAMSDYIAAMKEALRKVNQESKDDLMS